jgi:hypothetical protein
MAMLHTAGRTDQVGNEREESHPPALHHYLFRGLCAYHLLNYLLLHITMASGYGNNGGMCSFPPFSENLLVAAPPWRRITTCAPSSRPRV